MIAGSPPAKGHSEEVWVDRIDHPEEVDRAVERIMTDTGINSAWIHGSDPEGIWQRIAEHFEPVTAAGGAISDERGRLLVIHRKGKWDLPKGKVDPGETLEEAAIREVREECGLRSLWAQGHLCDTWHTYHHKGRHLMKRTVWFLMGASAKEKLVPQVEEDIDVVKWLDPGDIWQFRANTYPTLRAVIDAWEAAHRRRT
ncbi:MAG: NUDIX domain-containing protein [Flavobacteriales bacterium]|nr:NUDIX domain-containing protein [Flavobacteriales bacterium]